MIDENILDGVRAMLSNWESEEGAQQAEAELAAGAQDQADREAFDDAQRTVVGIDGTPFEQDLPEERPWAKEMSDEDLVAFVTNAAHQSYSGEQGELANVWASALGYYYADKREGDDQREEDGYATEQSTDVMDVVEAVMAQIMPTFDSTCVFRYMPQGTSEAELSADERAAEEESLYVNHVLMGENPGYLELQDGFRDAMLLRVGFFKTTLEEDVRIRVRQYPPLNAEQMQALEMSLRQQGHQYDITSKDDGDLVVTTREKISEVRFSAVPPEEMRWTSTHRTPVLDKIPFICHERIVRVNELVDAGYDPEKIAQLPTYSQDTQSVAIVRSRFHGENWFTEFLANDTRPVLIREAYPLIDYDGDGYAERRKVVVGDNTVLLENVPVDDHPFSMCVPITRSHRSVGIGMYDRMKWVQDTKTRTLRATLDNFDQTNVPELMIEVGGVGSENMGSVLNRSKGGVIKMARMGSVQYPPMRSIGQDGFSLMDYMDKARSERGGASMDMQTNQLASPQTAHGVEREVSAKELTSAFIASTMVQTGFVPAVLKAHALLRQSGRGSVAAKVAGKRIVTTDPSQWPERTEAIVSTSITLGEKLRRQTSLTQLIGTQQQLMQAGQDGVLVDMQGLYNALLDMARVHDLDTPEQYFVDPLSPQAQQAQAQKAQQAQQQAQEQQAAIQMQAEMQANMLFGVERLRNEGRTQSEMIRAQSAADKIAADVHQTLIKVQADMNEAMANLAQDNQHFQDELAKDYDELRVKLVDLEGKYGGDQEGTLTGETP